MHQPVLLARPVRSPLGGRYLSLRSGVGAQHEWAQLHLRPGGWLVQCTCPRLAASLRTGLRGCGGLGAALTACRVAYAAWLEAGEAACGEPELLYTPEYENRVELLFG